MTEFLKGRDVKLFADGKNVGGVLDITVQEEKRFYEVFEYLNDMCFERIPLESRYLITVTMLEKKNSDNPFDGVFDLRVCGKDKDEGYSQCFVESCKKIVTGGAEVQLIYTIRSYNGA